MARQQSFIFVNKTFVSKMVCFGSVISISFHMLSKAKCSWLQEKNQKIKVSWEAILEAIWLSFHKGETEDQRG